MKTAISSLLNHYYRNLPVTFLYETHEQQRKTVEYGNIEAAALDLGCSVFILQELYSYYLFLDSYFDNNPELLNMAKSDHLAGAFFEERTLLEPDKYDQKYIPVFEILLNRIKQEKHSSDEELQRE